MTKEKSKNKISELVDNFLLLIFFIVVFFAIFFIFAIIMQFNGKIIFLNFFQSLWNPLIIPLITILITSALANGIIAWWRRKWLSQEEDI